MEFDQSFFDNVKNMDDAVLSEAILAIAGQMGVDRSLVQHYLKDMSKVKDAVSSLDAEGYERIRRSLGEEKTNEVINTLRSQMKE